MGITTKIKYVGRPSVDFYGKYLSEIARNLCGRGKGRVVVKESEERNYKEPSFYVIKTIEPLMSDSVSFHYFVADKLYVYLLLLLSQA